MKFHIALFAAIAVAAACSASQPSTAERTAVNHRWDFNSSDEVENDWAYYHQDTASITQWRVADGMLQVTTRANTLDRSKVFTAERRYADGIYRWRTFIPDLQPGEQVSIGSWIYHDDHHELDFEVGSGKLEMRQQFGLDPNDSTTVLACMTNQDHPFISNYVPIKTGWHDFELRLELRPEDGNDLYTAVWCIDGKEYQRTDLKFGPEIGFTIQCSVENLRFLGDFPATADHTGLYDHVSFAGHLSE